MINVNLINHEDWRNCTEDSLATIMAYIKKEYILLFKDAWYFNYIRPSEKQGIDKIGPYLNFDGRVIANFEALSRYHGVRYNYHAANENINMYLIIKSELQLNKPVAIDIDGFVCPWLTSFQKVHIDHGIVISEMDFINKTFVCVDSFYQKNKVILPFEYFDKGVLGLYLYELTNADKYIWYEILENILLNYEKYKSIDKLIDFKNDFEIYFDFSKEIAGYSSYEVSPFYNGIDRYRQTRKKVAKVLEYIGNDIGLPIVNRLSYEMLEVYSCWNILHKYLMKTYFSEKYSETKTKVLNYINNIINTEKIFHEKLRETLTIL